MIKGVHISQEMFANDILTALKPSLEHGRKHVLRMLRLYGDQAYAWFPLDRNAVVKSHDQNKFWLTANVLVTI